MEGLHIQMSLWVLEGILVRQGIRHWRYVADRSTFIQPHTLIILSHVWGWRITLSLSLDPDTYWSARHSLSRMNLGTWFFRLCLLTQSEVSTGREEGTHCLCVCLFSFHSHTVVHQCHHVYHQSFLEGMKSNEDCSPNSRTLSSRLSRYKCL